MTKNTLVKYAKQIFELDKKRGGEDFSVAMIAKELGVSRTYASIILRKLKQEEFLIRIKMIGLREPIYIIDEKYSEKILMELEKEVKNQEKKQ